MVTMLERVQAMVRGEEPDPPVARLVGFKAVAVAPGSAVFEMEAGPQHANPMGTLHGGILCDLADAAMGTAYASTLEEGETFTTLECGRPGCALKLESSSAARRLAWSSATYWTRYEASLRGRAAPA